MSENEIIVISNDHRVARSKNCVNATPEHCCNFGDDRQWIFQSCEGSTAFEEQCEHSLTCNDEKFILSHFDHRHLRRDVCHRSCASSDNQSESSSQSYPIQTQEGQESSVNDNDDHESTPSDGYFSPNQVDHWENEYVSPNKNNTSAKDLSFNEI